MLLPPWLLLLRRLHRCLAPVPRVLAQQGHGRQCLPQRQDQGPLRRVLRCLVRLSVRLGLPCRSCRSRRLMTAMRPVRLLAPPFWLASAASS